MVAEKRLERAKSSAVQKMERQAIHNNQNASSGGDDTSKAKKEETVELNGVVDREALENAEAIRKAATAEAEKR